MRIFGFSVISLQDAPVLFPWDLQPEGTCFMRPFPPLLFQMPGILSQTPSGATLRDYLREMIGIAFLQVVV